MSQRMRWILIAIGAVALGLVGAWQVTLRSDGLEQVHDISSMTQLQDAFNRDAGSPRLIMLVSPT